MTCPNRAVSPRAALTRSCAAATHALAPQLHAPASCPVAASPAPRRRDATRRPSNTLEAIWCPNAAAPYPSDAARRPSDALEPSGAPATMPRAPAKTPRSPAPLRSCATHLRRRLAPARVRHDLAPVLAPPQACRPRTSSLATVVRHGSAVSRCCQAPTCHRRASLLAVTCLRASATRLRSSATRLRSSATCLRSSAMRRAPLTCSRVPRATIARLAALAALALPPHSRTPTSPCPNGALWVCIWRSAASPWRVAETWPLAVLASPSRSCTLTPRTPISLSRALAPQSRRRGPLLRICTSIVHACHPCTPLHHLHRPLARLHSRRRVDMRRRPHAQRRVG
ncbi:hypothetical protein DENSPDRAFT_886001 [Dentipellis sp. KUC8613]|nr:hypothetical protein DENSPDRAFT_886001 [Dentipellis sp. KUC8613]